MSRSINLSEQLSRYLLNCNIDEHPVLEKCRAETSALFPDKAWFQISPEQASFMQFGLCVLRARCVLEIGTFTGYSSLAFALALAKMHGSDFTVVTIDKCEEYLTRARSYWNEAGVSASIEPRLGMAADVLDELCKTHAGKFDAVFVDADKSPVQEYFERSLQLLREGGLMWVDNVLWDGRVADETQHDADTEALRAISIHAKRDPRVIHNVCAVGDGILMCLKSSESR